MLIQLYKNAFSGLSKKTWLLSLVMLINRSGTMVIPFMSLYMTRQMHVSYGKAGIVMGLFGAGSIFGALIGGKLSDKIGYYKVMCSALLLGGIMFIVLSFVKTYNGICCTVFILALFNEAFRPANMSAVTSFSTTENRSRSNALNRLAINIGWSVGSSLGGYFATFNYQLLFWVDGITNLFALGLILYLLPQKKYDIKPIKVMEHKLITQPAYLDKPFLAFVFLSILFGACFFQTFSTLPLFFADGLHLSENYIGTIMALNGVIIAMFEMIIVFKLEGKFKITSFISIGTIVCGLSFLVYTFMPGTLWLAIGGMLLLTLGEMIAFPFMSTYWMGRAQTHNRGQYAGLYTLSWSAAQVLGPPLGTLIVDHNNFTILWLIVGGIIILVGLGYYYLPVKKHSI
jgi:predicted MFS family arabinose efflux permease